MPYSMITSLLLLVSTFAPAAQTRDARFITVEGATLRARYEAAVKAGRSAAPQTRFWTAYSFDVRPGVAVDPEIVEDQTIGAIVQGIGQALYEEMPYDDQGTPQADGLLGYLLPTIGELPPLILGTTVTPNPNTALGAKGAGEAGCIGTPPAIVNAVIDALGPSATGAGTASTDIGGVQLPLTPETVWRAARGQEVAR